MKVYKIRHKSNPNLFRGPGIYTRWKKNGKTWDTIGLLRSAISLAMRSKNNDFSDWEIVEYEMIEVSAKPVHEVISEKKLLELLQR